MTNGQRLINLDRLKIKFNSYEELDNYIISEYKTKTSQTIAEELGWKSHHCVTRLLKRLNVQRREQHAIPIHTVNQDYFENIDSLEKAYLLGFIAADGCVSCPIGRSWKLIISLGIKDRLHLESICKVLQSDYPISNVYTKSTFGLDNYCKWFWKSTTQIYNKKLVNDLIKHKITPKKSLTLDWPTTIPPEFMSGYLLGFFDGDGWASVSKDRIDSGRPKWQTFSVCSGSYGFLELYAKKLSKITGIEVKTPYIVKGKLSEFRLGYNAYEDCRKIYNILYSNANVYLERKKKKLESIFNYGKL
jgi:hypothetical protein